MNFINTFDSDSSDEEGGVEYTCSDCNDKFMSNSRGSSIYKSLCSTCHEKLKNKFLEEVELTEREETQPSKSYTPPVPPVPETEGTADEITDLTSKENAEGDAIEKDNEAIWPESVLSLFHNKNEMSVEIEVGGFSQCFVRKKFANDPSSSVLQLYADVEIFDKCPELYYYIPLSAHYNRSKKCLLMARSIVVNNKTHEKYIVLSILRTKCPKPRYDPVLLDVTSMEIFRLTGTVNFRAEYTYVPDEEFDNTLTKELFLKWVVDSDLVWDKTVPNKDELGRNDMTTWDPISNASGRVRRTTAGKSAARTEHEVMKSKLPPMNKEDKGKTKKVRRSKEKKIPPPPSRPPPRNSGGNSIDNDDDEDDEHDDNEKEKGASGSEDDFLKKEEQHIVHLQAQLKLKKELKEKRLRLERELLEVDMEEDPQLPPPKKYCKTPSEPAAAPSLQPGDTISIANSSARTASSAMTLHDITLIQTQTCRTVDDMNRERELRLRLQGYEFLHAQGKLN